jgi:hypothetical protein
MSLCCRSTGEINHGEEDIVQESREGMCHDIGKGEGEERRPDASDNPTAIDFQSNDVTGITVIPCRSRPSAIQMGFQLSSFLHGFCVPIVKRDCISSPITFNSHNKESTELVHLRSKWPR